MEVEEGSKTLNDGLLASLALKAHWGAFKAVGAFQAAARPLFAGTVASGRRLRGVGDEGSASPGCDLGRGLETDSERGQTSLAELAEGPYFLVASLLDASALCHADATCRLLRTLNRANAGPWRSLGARAFAGLELDREGTFEGREGQQTSHSGRASGRKHQRIDWKGRYARFLSQVPTFRAPFTGPEITTVRTADEVAYCRCRLRTDLLESDSCGVYLEVEVISNADNLSLAVVDFEAGGRSSVTFSPDTGAVIRERKIREAPRKVEGAYIQPLPATPQGRRFEGCMGVYLRAGQLAFFRRCVIGGSSPPSMDDDDAEPEVGPWECTGFITDLTWSEGRRLTPCIAFRDEGTYRVRVSRVGPESPLEPLKTSSAAYNGVTWSSLDWEAGNQPPAGGGAPEGEAAQ